MLTSRFHLPAILAISACSGPGVAAFMYFSIISFSEGPVALASDALGTLASGAPAAALVSAGLASGGLATAALAGSSAPAMVAVNATAVRTAKAILFIGGLPGGRC